MKKIVWIAIFIFAASLLSCANTDRVYQPGSYSFNVKIPAGWRKIDRPYLLITKEGPFLQNIMVQNRSIRKAFRFTKKKMQKDMLPEEAAQVIIDEYISDKNIGNLKILNNVPADINGHNGFQIYLTYTGPKGHEFHTLYYGFIKADTFFNLRFTAGGRQYYQKDIETFRRMMTSFEVVKVPVA